MTISRREMLTLPLASLAAEGDVPRQIAELTETCQRLHRITTELAEQLSWLSRTAPPVGTVMAFAGEWPPARAGGVKWTEAELGWLLCDGRKLEEVELSLQAQLEKPGDTTASFSILRELGTVLGWAKTLPDYRGCFLRGVDRGLNGKSSERDKGGIRPVGGIQEAATATPLKEFVTTEAGKHNHKVPSSDSQGDFDCLFRMRKDADFTIKEWDKTSRWPALDAAKPMADAGNHQHKIEGGDAETRPVNVAVYWIIRFK